MHAPGCLCELKDNTGQKEGISILCTRFATVKEEDGSPWLVERIVDKIVLEKGLIDRRRSIEFVIWEVIRYLVECIA